MARAREYRDHPPLRPRQLAAILPDLQSEILTAAEPDGRLPWAIVIAITKRRLALRVAPERRIAEARSRI